MATTQQTDLMNCLQLGDHSVRQSLADADVTIVEEVFYADVGNHPVTAVANRQTFL